MILMTNRHKIKDIIDERDPLDLFPYAPNDEYQEIINFVGIIID